MALGILEKRILNRSSLRYGLMGGLMKDCSVRGFPTSARNNDGSVHSLYHPGFQTLCDILRLPFQETLSISGGYVGVSKQNLTCQAEQDSCLLHLF